MVCHDEEQRCGEVRQGALRRRGGDERDDAASGGRGCGQGETVD